jgi:hypothetical protein
MRNHLTRWGRVLAAIATSVLRLGLGAGHWQVPGLRGGHHTADDFFACPSNVKDKIAVGIYGAGRQCFVEEIIRIVLAYRLPAGLGGFL